MKKGTPKHHMDAVLVLLLFGVFAACILSVLLTGADLYQRLLTRDSASFEQRTAAQYLATKVRQSDVLGAVAVEPFDDTQALVLREEIAGEDYVTYIYCSDGYLCELFCAADAALTGADGERVLPAEELQLSLENGLLHAVLLDETGGSTEIALLCRAEGRAES